jgi:molecular chaperone DnaK (HSP70)
MQSNVWTCSVAEGEKKSVTFETHEPRAQDVETTRRTFSAQELATSVLKQLASDASSVSGRDVQGCVLSVAPNATKEENEAMVEAAKQAGFDEIAMLRSDVAVALAYGFDKQSVAEESDTEEEATASAEGETKGETKGTNGVEMGEEAEEEEEAGAAIINSPIQRILVLDVGARSCTASILLCSDGLFQAVHTVTQEGVGGWYIDEALVAFCAKEFNRTSKTT